MMIEFRRRAILFAIIVICTVVGLLQNVHNLNDFRGPEKWATRGGAPPLRQHPPTEEYFWEKRECSSCIYADKVCSDNTGWFYAPPHSTTNEERDDGDKLLNSQQRSSYQPTITLVYDRKELRRTHAYLHGLQVSKQIQFHVSSTSHRRYNDTICSYLSVPNHVVVQSAYNEMIGEFYVRTILPLNQWMRDFPTRAEDIQTYVHFVDRRKELFHGHKLFLGGLSNNGVYDNLVSLMPMDDDTSCRCYRKLIFCGYKVKNITTSMNLERGIHSVEESFIITPGAAITNPKTDTYDLNDIIGDPIYDDLRKDIVNTYLMKDPDLNEKIIQYQIRMLIDKGIVVHNNTNISSIDVVGGWRFVGLTHRKYRRVWLNIDDFYPYVNKSFAFIELCAS